MKLLVLGAGGQVGRELARAALPAGMRLVAFDRAALDVTDADAVAAAVARERPDVVINAAAYTAVDRAESEPAAAAAANAAAPGHIAAACAAAGAALIHYSTDYVFDGTKPGAYVEDDPVNPLGVYGRTKAAGERAVRAALERHVILRTSWVYAAHGRNFVRTMLRLADERGEVRVVADQHGAPTAAADIAAATLRIAAQGGPWGTFHFANAGETTWHGFAAAIFALAGKTPRLSAIATAEFPSAATRPANSRLDCAKLAAAYGIVARPWQEALAPVVAELTA